MREGPLYIVSACDGILSSIHTRVEELLSGTNAISDRLIAELDAVHCGGNERSMLAIQGFRQLYSEERWVFESVCVVSCCWSWWVGW